MAINTFNGRIQVVEIDFGVGSDLTSAQILDENTRATSCVSAVLGGPSADHDVEDAMIEQIVLSTSVQAGIGYTVHAHAPSGTWGRYNVIVSCVYF